MKKIVLFSLLLTACISLSAAEQDTVFVKGEESTYRIITDKYYQSIADSASFRLHPAYSFPDLPYRGDTAAIHRVMEEYLVPYIKQFPEDLVCQIQREWIGLGFVFDSDGSMLEFHCTVPATLSLPVELFESMERAFFGLKMKYPSDTINKRSRDYLKTMKWVMSNVLFRPRAVYNWRVQ